MEQKKNSNSTFLEILKFICIFGGFFILLAIGLMVYSKLAYKNYLGCVVKITDRTAMGAESVDTGYQYTAEIISFDESDYDKVLQYFDLEDTKTALLDSPIMFQYDEKIEIGEVIHGKVDKKFWLYPPFKKVE